jgi:hypothetical protein
MMANPALQQRMAALREDPEFRPMFEEIQKGGMQVRCGIANYDLYCIY